jgi:hypothetical protein
MRLIRYYKSPYFVLIFSTLNHILRLRNISHPLIWVSSQMHLYSRISSSVIMPFLKTLIHTSHCTTSYGRSYLCHVSISSVLRICLSNIKFQYGVWINLAYSSPFSRLSSICLTITWQFASKSDYCYKLWVTIQFILLHNPSSSKCMDYYAIFTTLTT